MEDASGDLELVRLLSELLRRQALSSNDADHVEIRLIENRIREIVGNNSQTSEPRRLLKNILEKNPSLLFEITVETVGEIIRFALDCYRQYVQIQSGRALTDEEKNVGKQVMQCLNQAKSLIEYLRGN